MEKLLQGKRTREGPGRQRDPPCPGPHVLREAPGPSGDLRVPCLQVLHGGPGHGALVRLLPGEEHPPGGGDHAVSRRHGHPARLHAGGQVCLHPVLPALAHSPHGHPRLGRPQSGRSASCPRASPPGARTRIPHESQAGLPHYTLWNFPRRPLLPGVNWPAGGCRASKELSEGLESSPPRRHCLSQPPALASLPRCYQDAQAERCPWLRSSQHASEPLPPTELCGTGASCRQTEAGPGKASHQRGAASGEVAKSPSPRGGSETGRTPNAPSAHPAPTSQINPEHCAVSCAGFLPADCTLGLSPAASCQRPPGDVLDTAAD